MAFGFRPLPLAGSSANFSITVDTGVFTLTGVAATFGRTLTNAAGSYTLTGVAALMFVGTIGVAATGTFTETGVAATFNHRITVATGSFVETGQAATPTPGLLTSSIVTYIGHVEATGITANPFTAVAVPIGTASSDRIVVAVLSIFYTGAVGADGNPSAVTIGGVSATEHIERTAGVPAKSISIWSAPVPTGTTGDIVVTKGALLFSGGIEYSIATYTLTGVSPTVTDTASASSAGAMTLDVDLHQNDIVIGGELSISAFGTGTASWVGATENYDYTVSSTFSVSGAHFKASTEEFPRTVTVTPAGVIATGIGVSAAWRPLSPVATWNTGTFTETSVATIFNQRMTEAAASFTLTGLATAFSLASRKRVYGYIFR